MQRNFALFLRPSEEILRHCVPQNDMLIAQVERFSRQRCKVAKLQSFVRVKPMLKSQIWAEKPPQPPTGGSDGSNSPLWGVRGAAQHQSLFQHVLDHYKSCTVFAPLHPGDLALNFWLKVKPPTNTKQWPQNPHTRLIFRGVEPQARGACGTAPTETRLASNAKRARSSIDFGCPFCGH